MALPNGYTRLEYIKSSGEQYVDTGFTPNNNTSVEVEFMWTGSTATYLYGAVDSNNAKSFTATLSTTGGNWRFDGTAYKYTAKANTLYTAVMDSSGVTINGTLNKYAGIPSSFTAPCSLTIFAGKNASGTMASYFSGKVYYFKIYDNGTLVRDLIPCKNASGAVGLYDTVNGVFYANKGSGTFTAGPEIADEYKIVNATELDGALSAEANAIRAKTGATDKIPWNASTGFASAIAAISSGGKVATGTFTISAGSTNRARELIDFPQTITGLSFTPTRVIFFLDLSGNIPTPWESDTIMYGDSQSGKCYVVSQSEYDDDEGYTIEEYNFQAIGSSEGFLFNITSNGFTIKANNSTFAAYADWCGGCAYHYIALG